MRPRCAFMASREGEECFCADLEESSVLMSEGALSMILQRSMYWRAEVASLAGSEDGGGWEVEVEEEVGWDCEE